MITNRMFLLSFSNSVVHCLNVFVKSDSGLWHLRYGHLGYDRLEMLAKRCMVVGLPSIKKDMEGCCEACLIGEQARTSFKKHVDYKARRLLKIVYSEVCGPIDHDSFGGHKYFLLFVDALSIKTWIYFLIEKSVVFSKFKVFKVMVENQTRLKIGTPHIDRGGKFLSREFSEFCEEHGIRRFITPSYTPQYIGVVERQNRTILNMVRSMLAGKGLPKQLWAEAAACVVYLMNRSPTKQLDGITP